MPGWDLPESAELGGGEWRIRSDFRVALDILGMLSSPEMDDGERAEAALTALFPDFERMPPALWQDAADWLQWYLAGGNPAGRAKGPRLADWEQDFPIIAAPVNRVLGFDARGREHVHWWTFLAAYLEVGDCLFAQVVSIRRKRARGEKLDKRERRFYRENRELVDFKAAPETEAEAEELGRWLGKAGGEENGI